MAKPLVAIVGRPNVGKSMLFNKIGRPAPVHRGGHPRRHPGPALRRVRVARPDLRHSWTPAASSRAPTTEILSFMRQQAEIAIQNATVIVFLCDIKTGLTAADQEVANMLLRSRQARRSGGEQDGPTGGRPTRISMSSTTWAWATPSPSPPSTATAPATCWTPASSTSPRRRTRRRRTTSSRWPSSASPTWASPPSSTAFWGRSGSSSPTWPAPPGTPWTATLKMSSGKYRLHRHRRDAEKVQGGGRHRAAISVLRATMAIDRSDVCLIMIDANEGVTEQDTKVAGHGPRGGQGLHHRGEQVGRRGEGRTRPWTGCARTVRRDLAYMTYAPILFISALTGQRVDKLFELINVCGRPGRHAHHHRHAQQPAGRRHGPGAAPHGQGPPPEDLLYDPGGHPAARTLSASATTPKLFHFSYQRYLENQIRSTFGLEGTPIRLTIRQRGDKED